MSIITWLKRQQRLRRIINAPLLRIVYEHVGAAYGRYVFLLSRTGKSVTASTDERCPLLLITIAFNHEGLIRKQIEMVRKHVKGTAFQHIILDNSSSISKRRAIKKVCDDTATEYIAVPRRITWLTCNSLFYPSYSHGAALNWAYFHIIQSRKPHRFVLLDHDIMPVKPYDFIAALGTQDFYGLERRRECGWYLWPGFSIFSYDAIADKKVDFSPVYVKHTYLDAGGHNFLSIFCNYYPSDLRFAINQPRRIRITQSLRTYDDIYHGDFIQVIDNAWIHIINGSNYAHIRGKENIVNQLIDKLEDII